MKDKLPRYSISIDEGYSPDGEKLGMTQVAYTSTPAILTKGLAFNLTKGLAFTDELKYRLAAPAMIPNIPIYREDEELGAYEVIFSAEVIEKLRTDFMLNKGKAAFNIDHNSEFEAPSFILDSWITGPSATDPSFTKYGIEVPEGSWFVVSQFTDKEFFKNEIIGKDRIGYSIEGFLGMSLALSQINKNKENMNEQKFALPDGEYVMENGDVMVIVDGQITEVKPKVEAPAEEVVVEEAPAEMVDAPLMDEPVADVPVVEAPADTTTLTKEYVDGKLEEIYGMIAEIKTQLEIASVEDAGEVIAPVLNAQLSLASFINELNK